MQPAAEALLLRRGLVHRRHGADHHLGRLRAKAPQSESVSAAREAHACDREERGARTSMYRSQQLARHCTSLLLMLPPGLVMHFVKQRSRTVCAAQDRGGRAVRGMRVSAARETRDARERATRRTVMNSCALRGESAAGLLSAQAMRRATRPMRCAAHACGRGAPAGTAGSSRPSPAPRARSVSRETQTQRTTRRKAQRRQRATRLLHDHGWVHRLAPAAAPAAAAAEVHGGSRPGEPLRFAIVRYDFSVMT